MLIAVYQGNSIGSRAIRFWTRDIASHTSLVFNGVEYEAWSKSERTRWYRPFAGYFQEVPFGKNHKKGTPVQLFSVKNLTKKKEKAILIQNKLWAKQKVPYDYRECLNFVTKKNKGDATKLKCSEATVESCERGGHPLLARTQSWKISPRDIRICKELELVANVKIGDDISHILKKY